MTKRSIRVAQAILAVVLVLVLLASFACTQPAASPTPSPTASKPPTTPAGTSASPSASPTQTATAKPSTSPSATGTPASQQPISFVEAEDLSGPIAAFMTPVAAGIEDGIKYVNTELGGINGHPLVRELFDHAYDVKKANSIYQQVMTRDKKPILFKSAFSTWQMSMLTRFKEDKIVLWGTSEPKAVFPEGWTAKSTDEPGWAFSDYINNCELVGGFVQWMLKDWEKTRTHEGPPRLAILGWDNAAGHGLEEKEAIAYVQSLGIEVVSKEFFPASALTIVEQLNRIKAAKADWIISWVHILSTPMVLKEMASLDMVPPNVRVCFHWAGVDHPLFSRATDAVKKVQPFVAGPIPTFDMKDNKLVQIAQKYYTANNRPADMYSMGYLHGWSIIPVMVELFKKALNTVGYEKLNSQAVYDAFKTLQITDTLGRKMDFTGNKRYNSAMFIAQMKTDGSIVPLTDYFQAPDLRPGGADVPAGTYK